MKYILFVFLLTGFVFSGCTSGKAALGDLSKIYRDSGDAADAVFEGTAAGYRGPITVQVRLNGGKIMEILVVDSSEDRFTGAAAIEELIDLVIENNSADVDAVSGATESSRGFLEAVQNAILKL